MIGWRGGRGNDLLPYNKNIIKVAHYVTFFHVLLRSSGKYSCISIPNLCFQLISFSQRRRADGRKEGRLVVQMSAISPAYMESRDITQVSKISDGDAGIKEGRKKGRKDFGR